MHGQPPGSLRDRHPRWNPGSRAARRRLPAPVTAALLAVAVLGQVGLPASTLADDDTAIPTRAEVRTAEQGVRDQRTTLASVQAELAAADARLEGIAVAAGQAAEAYNGARYALQRSRAASRRADRAADRAARVVDGQRQLFTDTATTSYEASPTLTALAAVLDSDGIQALLHRTATLQGATEALAERYDAYRAAADRAEAARVAADRARRRAAAAEQQARRARDRAASAARAAAAAAEAIAAEKGALIARLARLQRISIALAARRQAALDQRTAQQAASPPPQPPGPQPPEPQDQPPASPAGTTGQGGQDGPGGQDGQGGQGGQHGAGGSGHPAPPTPPQPQPQPQPQPHPQPPASSGARAAVAFARAQIGDPYRWGAAGPDAWDCSGLTMGAWRAGGKTLPHYSVAQYEQSTPISVADLRPGDLVFWGSSSRPSSIYHVAIYVGNGRVVNSPRTGETVREESMYSWITPNFYARP